ncbi:MAG: DUF120 domain-containing protein [Planctomycetota bacterium]
MPTLVGYVESGMGDFGRWIAELRDHYHRKTGLDLHPGTLNVRLEEPYRLPPDPIRLEGHEYGGRVSVSLVPCRVFDRAAFILRTDANERGDGDHLWEVVEVATDVKLRDAFGLTDGDRVVIEV